ncbi:TetR family transcriptional regulator [Spongiactinospora sp. TRM90649]|uniref:TetR/AcrR family transcriptional regulator n=1 Tax=Spongiactinospora sp. TRM90649 TaxID=3031114 RepID=UPI0023F7AB2E|nr:TetR family transcriptional regulator [Spongiactinospora sp. TRM90649]MDF5756037.1 TetR family transcriptional regulator [Spongiactinospora sp. TRM90649]
MEDPPGAGRVEAPPSRRRDRAATRAALLAAARIRFARSGYEATSVRDVARDAGVDPTLIFRYFGSKQGLFDEAAKAGRQEGASLLDGDAADLPDLLLRSVLSQNRAETGGEHPFVAMLRSSTHEPAHRMMREQICDGFLANLAGLVEGPDARLRAELLGALILGISVSRSVVRSPALAEAGHDDIEPYYRRIAALLLGPDDEP